MRIEDLDRPRVIRGKSDEILRALELHGLEWDGPVLSQSTRSDAYQTAYDRLRSDGLLYPCVCSRRTLQAGDGVGEPYPGHCRQRMFDTQTPGHYSSRLRIEAKEPIGWDDRFLGPQRYTASQIGDVAVRRRDGLFTYHLAAVVDDAAQGVTSIVRGNDLLDSTPWQLVLQRTLGIARPRYGHTPLVTEPGGAKLAKARRSAALAPADASGQLLFALAALGQDVHRELIGAPPSEILRYATGRWNPDRFQSRLNVPITKNFVPGERLY